MAAPLREHDANLSVALASPITRPARLPEIGALARWRAPPQDTRGLAFRQLLWRGALPAQCFAQANIRLIRDAFPLGGGQTDV